MVGDVDGGGGGSDDVMMLLHMCFSFGVEPFSSSTPTAFTRVREGINSSVRPLARDGVRLVVECCFC